MADDADKRREKLRELRAKGKSGSDPRGSDERLRQLRRRAETIPDAPGARRKQFLRALAQGREGGGRLFQDLVGEQTGASGDASLNQFPRLKKFLERRRARETEQSTPPVGDTADRRAQLEQRVNRLKAALSRAERELEEARRAATDKSAATPAESSDAEGTSGSDNETHSRAPAAKTSKTSGKKRTD